MGLWSVSMLVAAELLRVLRVPSTVVALAQGLVQVTFSRSDRTFTLALPCAGPIFCQLSGAPASPPQEPPSRAATTTCQSMSSVVDTLSVSGMSSPCLRVHPRPLFNSRQTTARSASRG
jgi:hypothetical protein